MENSPSSIFSFSIRLLPIWFHGAIYKYHLSVSTFCTEAAPHQHTHHTSWLAPDTHRGDPRPTPNTLDPMWSKQIYFCFHLTKECAASTHQDSFHGVWQRLILGFGAVSVMVFCLDAVCGGQLHQHPSHWSVTENTCSVSLVFNAGSCVLLSFSLCSLWHVWSRSLSHIHKVSQSVFILAQEAPHHMQPCCLRPNPSQHRGSCDVHSLSHDLVHAINLYCECESTSYNWSISDSHWSSWSDRIWIDQSHL